MSPSLGKWSSWLGRHLKSWWHDGKWGLLSVAISLLSIGVGFETFSYLRLRQTDWWGAHTEKIRERLALKMDEKAFGKAILEMHSVAGWGGTGPGTVSREIYKVEGKTIYDVTYEYDTKQRRVISKDRAQRNGLVLLGGSYTFGQGVEANETFGYHLDHRFKDYSVYNYGLGGWGTNQLLARFTHYDIGEEVKQKQGLALYFWIDDHLIRVAGSMKYFKWAKTNTPYYDFDSEGNLVNMGTFGKARPFTTFLYKWVGAMLLKSLTVQQFGIDLPLFLYRRQKYVDLVARLTEAMRDQIRTKLPGYKFLVVLWPGSHYGRKRIAPELKKVGIEYLDYSQQDSYFQIEGYPADTHPTAAHHKFMADILAKDLVRFMPARHLATSEK